MTQPYKHPPITEAVIAINFSTPMEANDVEKASEKLASDYPQHQNVENVKLSVQLPSGQDDRPTTEYYDREVGHRRASPDMTELVVLWRSAFVISQLAPYPGWEIFFQRFVRDWTIWKRVMGFHQINRVGVRYINRIDIPVSGPTVEHEAFLNVYPKLPDTLGPIGPYAVQAVSALDDIGCSLILNSAMVPSPILNHASFVIDQDIVKEINPPQSDEAIYELLNVIRERKNKVFEDCIRDPARELFQK